jgi:methyl-accepting chemotaxis protein
MPMPQNTTDVSSWKDRDGRSWSTSISVTTIARVKETTGVNLLEIVEGKLLPQFLDDPLLLVEVLHVISKAQVDERGVSKEAFGDLFIGDVTVDAVNALVQGLLDFFPSGRREMIQRLWQATERAQNEAVKMATNKLNSPLVEQALTGAIQKASDEIDQQLKQLGDTSTNSPELSASTPAR